MERVNEQLAKNVDSVSKNFINENSEKIVQGFKAQLGILKEMLEKLNEKAKAFKETDPDKLDKEEKETVKNIAAAIVEIDEKIGRLGKDRIGGFQKKLPSGEKTEETDTPKNRTGFTPITKCDAKRIEQYEKAVKTVEDATSKLNKADLSGYEDAKKQLNDAKNDLKSFEEEQLKPNVMQDNLEILKQNIETLEGYAKNLKNGDSEKLGKNFELGLNLVQQACFSAWMFNDIREKVEKVIDPEIVKKLFSGTESEKMLKLNQEARKTEMFVEVTLKKLFSESEFKEFENASKNSPELRLLLDAKFGWRGRLGNEESQKQESVEEQPFENTLNKQFSNDKDVQSAKYTSVQPDRTANLRTAQERSINALNALLKDETFKAVAQKIAGRLVDKGLLTWINNETVKANNSYTNVINEAGLSAHCGPSGTTGEFISVLRYTQPEKMKQIFSGILEISRTGKLPKDFNCSEVLGMVALFMETGHCHTTSEAIGGLYSVAVADHNVEKALGSEHPERKNTSQGGYGNLLNAFKNNMSAFLEPKNAIA